MDRVFAVLIAAWPLAPLASAAQANSPAKPITHEALWMMKRVGTPLASPDGKWVVYSVLEPSYETEKAESDLWLVPVDGSKPPRRITNTKAAENNIAWSPDGGSIAFTTKRESDDAEQIYVLNLAGGRRGASAHKHLHGATNPSGGRTARQCCSSPSYPNAADDEANKKIAAERKRANTTCASTNIFRSDSGINGWTTANRPSWCNRLSPAHNPRTFFRHRAGAHFGILRRGRPRAASP